MTTFNRTISPLRQRLIDDMTLRKLAPKTQSGYIRAVKNLTQFLRRSPDTATPEDLRRFQLHMVSNGVSRITLNATISGRGEEQLEANNRSAGNELDSAVCNDEPSAKW